MRYQPMFRYANCHWSLYTKVHFCTSLSPKAQAVNDVGIFFGNLFRQLTRIKKDLS